MASLAEKVSVGILLVVALAFAVAPDLVGQLLAPGVSMLTAGIMWASRNLPRPVFLGVIFLATLVVSILIAISTARVGYAILKRAGPRTQRVYRKATPSTPIGKFAVFMFFGIGILLGSVWVLPGAIGNLGENSSVSDADDLAQTGTPVSRLAVFDGDAHRPGGDGDQFRYRRPSPDTDGDRLKDGWEEAGETVDGAALSDADPQRMDLYVQVNYGGGTIPLTDQEKRQLRQVWAEMPVENPDGSTGITIHVDDQRPRGGGIGEVATFSGDDAGEISRYYRPHFMGNRTCVYHQVVVGTIDRSRLAGIGHAPGYAAVVESERRNYDGELSPRVHAITHELLHNVVGPIGENGHTSDGWLSPTISSDSAFLPDAAASRLEQRGLAGSGYYQQQLC
jgi:hypothetical protein